MQVEELFRFPEEHEWEAALRAMPKEDLLAALDRLAGAVPQPESDRQTAQACEALAGLRGETERFLRTWRGRVDVFGDVPDRETFYRAFCALQRALEDGTQRLRGMAARKTAPHVPRDVGGRAAFPGTDCGPRHNRCRAGGAGKAGGHRAGRGDRSPAAGAFAWAFANGASRICRAGVGAG